MLKGLWYKTKKNKAGLSILEIVISALLFALTAVGVITLLSSIRPQAATSERSISAAHIAEDILAQLRGKVDAETYDTGDLAVGTYETQSTVSGIVYNVTYIITDDTDTGGRLVDMTVSWDE